MVQIKPEKEPRVKIPALKHKIFSPVISPPNMGESVVIYISPRSRNNDHSTNEV